MHNNISDILDEVQIEVDWINQIHHSGKGVSVDSMLTHPTVMVGGCLVVVESLH